MASLEASSTKRVSSPLLIATTTKRVRLDVPQDTLISLHAELNGWSKNAEWAYQLQQASGHPLRLTLFLSQVLGVLLGSLAESTLKDKFISPMLPAEARRFVDDFTADERQEWEDRVKMGIESGEWGDLIIHPRLQPVAITPNKGRESLETMEERSMRLHAMFSRKYRGEFHKLFVGALDDYHKIYDRAKHFGRIVPIIQSSGTGKSRLVSEMASEVPTLSVCFREGQLPENGWPPPDIPARDLLLRHRPVDKKFKGEELAAAFLGAVMAVVASKIEAHGDIAPQGDWMDDWRLDSINVTGSRRHTYFTEVAAAAEDLLRENTPDIVNTRVSYNIQDLARDAIPPDSAPKWHGRLFTMLCRASFDKLSQILKKRKVKWFILAFDECSELNSTKPVSPGAPYRAPLWCMSLIALQRIIKAYDEFVGDVPFWFLLLDTNSSIIDMSPLGKDAPSDRFEKDLRSLPPWPNVGFNQMAEKNLFADKKKLPTDVHSMQHLMLYGRPYWSTLTDAEVWRVASKKLFSDEGFKAHLEDHVFAAFAVRVGLEIGVGEASERLAMEAVRSHMRVLDAVVGFMVITTSPPEPMLAIAAALAMNHSEATYKNALKTLLDKLILKGIVLDRGLLGELSSRLLLLRARDKATPGGKGCITLGKLPEVQPVQLSKFLQTLLGDTLGLSDKQSGLRDELLQEASSAWINFTHFYQLPHSIDEVTESMLVNAWSTGAAFQCALNQPVIDGFFVAYHGRLDKPFQRSKLTIIPWQTKAKVTAAVSSVAHSLTAPFIVPQNGGSRRKPWHVVILMDLAASSAFEKAKGPRCDLTHAIPTRPKRGEEGQEVWGGYAKANENEGTRYCLNIRGHRASTYPVLEGLEEQFDALFTRTLNSSAPELMPYMMEMERAKNCMILD